MNSSFFPNNRQSNRRPHGNNNVGNNYHERKLRNSMNFTDNFEDFQSEMHNSTMHPRNTSLPARNHQQGNTSGDLTSSSMTEEQLLFEKLFGKNAGKMAKEEANAKLLASSSSENSMEDDGGVYLQISNLDQYYDEPSLRNYLMNQMKPITPILSLLIDTPSIARVKVPSIQFAKQVVSHLHRKKMGHKRIFVSFLKDKTNAECSALRNKVIGLLRDVPSHQLPMSKFRELFQSRFKSSISILDLYRMPDTCTIGVNDLEEKIITLHMDTSNVNVDDSLLLPSEQHSAPYCVFHYKADKNKGWAEIEIEPLPNVFMSISQVQSIIHPLLRAHQGDIPIASILYCLEAELNINIQPNERGVSFEHLVSCVPKVQIRTNDYGIKTLSWREDNNSDDSLASLSWKSGNCKTSLASCGDAADNISKEVIELIRMSPKSTMQFSKFIPTYHNHLGKQCRVADYGCTKLIDLFEAMSSIVQVLGEGDSRHITLTHATQLRRFANDVFKILRNQPTRSICLSRLPQAFLSTHHHIFEVTDYGVCDLEDLVDGLRHNSFIVVTKNRDDSDDYLLSLQKRRQTNVEFEKTCIFAGEVVELLRNAPQYSIPFRKFVRSYHYHFGYQCKLSDYGYLRLAELLEALSGVVEMDNSNEENRKIFLSRKVALRIFSEQIQEIIKMQTGKAGTMVKVDTLMEMHKNKFGYQMKGSSLGYETVIDALKFVPFVELSSYDNELWLVSHMENLKFRQRAVLACLAIVDIGVKVPLSKFHAAFSEKFKFSIHEKTLHAMKHAVEIEMVNGLKMISLSHTSKFLMHISNLLEQRKKMSVQEIKSTLKLNLTACFNFGYANLSSLLQAYPDIFIGTKMGANLYERSEMELTPECLFNPLNVQKLLMNGQMQQADAKPEMYRPQNTASFNYRLSKHIPDTIAAGRKLLYGDKYNVSSTVQNSKPPSPKASPFSYRKSSHGYIPSTIAAGRRLLYGDKYDVQKSRPLSPDAMPFIYRRPSNGCLPIHVQYDAIGRPLPYDKYEFSKQPLSPDAMPFVYRKNTAVGNIPENIAAERNLLYADKYEPSTSSMQKSRPLSPDALPFIFPNNTAYENVDLTMPTDTLYQRYNNQPSVNQVLKGNQSFYESNLRYQQQQNQLPEIKRDYWNSSTNNSSGFSSTNSSLSSSNEAGYGQQSFGNSMNNPFACARTSDPAPKSETQSSSKPMSIWFDPIWKQEGDMFAGNCPPIPLGDGIGSVADSSLKSFNVHVVSPFMSFKTMFTFDSTNQNSNSNNQNNSINNQKM